MNNQAYSEKHIRRMKLFEREHLKAVALALHKQIQPVVNKLRTKGIEAAIASVDSVEINSALAAPIRDIYKTVGLYFANKTIHDLNQSAKQYLKEYLDKRTRELKAEGFVSNYVVGEEGPEIYLDPESALGKLFYSNKDFKGTLGDYNVEVYSSNRPETKAGFGFNAEFLQDILTYFKQFLLNLAVLPISETTKNQILQVISEGVTAGKGAEEIARELEAPELTLWRARLIVRTESNKAMNYGQRLGESKSEWESTKTWIAANDHRTRHSHRKVDDITLDFKERFLVPIYSGRKPYLQQGVDLMSGPGDVHASAGNICNCRCTLAFAAKRDANGRLVRKKAPEFVLP